MALGPPSPLADHHEIAAFSCGEPSLDDWLRRRSRANQASGATRTFIVADQMRVVAYYALSSGDLSCRDAPGRFRRNMPEPIPVAILARLAVDQAYAGQGLGRALMRDCGQRVLRAADTIGIRGVVVHAISEEAKDFYLRFGFSVSPVQPMTVMVTLADLHASLNRPS